MFRALIAGLSRRIPGQCVVCHSWPAQTVCESCVVRFAQPLPRCRTCALPVPETVAQCGRCLTRPVVLDSALAAVPYAYPWARMVVALKFHGQTARARSMATLMRSTPWVEPALEGADLVLPMPLSTQRLARRGFNQSVLLARALEPRKVRTDLLLRILDTPPQSSLPRAERMRSVKHAYAVEPLQVPLLANKRVLLVDDVMTTGASLFAAALALRQAGVAHIGALVFARADDQPEPPGP